MSKAVPQHSLAIPTQTSGLVLCKRSAHLTRDGTSAHVNMDVSATWTGMQTEEPRGTGQRMRRANPCHLAQGTHHKMLHLGNSITHIL